MTRRQEIFLVTAILLLAAFLRLYRLDQLPPGLHYDEAFNAVQARNVLSGIDRPIYFTGDLTEEPLAIYTASVFFALFGVSPFSLRLASAVIGILTVAVFYFTARYLFKSSFTAAISALVLAILYWHVNFSRLGMEPIFLPLMLTLAIGAMMRAYKPNASFPVSLTGRKRWGLFALAGLFFAATQYTYKAALFVPIFFAGIIITEIMFNRPGIIQNAKGLAVLLGFAVLAFAPLGLYWVAHPSEFIERPSTVLVAPSALLDNALHVGGMFFLKGDDNPRSNLPGRPVLDPFLAVGFLVGLAVCLARVRRFEARIILLWLVVMVLPSVLSDFAPHFGRSIGAAPAVALVSGTGFATLAKEIRPKLLAFCFLLLAFAFSAFSTFYDYFEIWGTKSGLYESFDVGLLTIAQRLRAEPPNETLFVTPVDSNHYTIQFALGGVQAASFDGRVVLPSPPSGGDATYAIVTRDDARSLNRLRKMLPTDRAIDTVYDFAGQPYAAIYHTRGPLQIGPQKRVDVRLGDGIALMGYDVARNGDAFNLTIYWRSIAETPEDYTVFAHLLDSSSRIVSQDDARPGHGTYLTSSWRAGQIIADDYRFSIPPNLPRAEYQIEFGMYSLDSGARVRMTDANGIRMENDRVLVERFTYP